MTVAATEPETAQTESTENLIATEQAETTSAPTAQESPQISDGRSIPTELICSLITFAGVIASALISRNVSKNTAVKEIEKMQLEWDREDLVSSEEDFSKMISAVAKYTSGLYRGYQREALGEIASVRAKENGDLALTLDQLYQAVYDARPRDIDKHLTNVINEKRKLKAKTSSDEAK